MITSRRLGIAAAALALLGLAGCATSSPSPTGTPRPSVSTSAAAVVAPTPRIAITCGKMLGLDELQAQLVDTISVRDDGSVPHDFSGAVLAQAGGLSCAWGGQDRTDSTYDTGLTLTVLPDSTADFAAFQQNPFVTGNTSSTVGTASLIHCNGVQAPCLADVLAGTTWLEFSYSDAKRAADPTSAVVMLLTKIVSRVQGLRPTSAWVPPGRAAHAVTCTDASGTALIGSSVSVQPNPAEPISLASAAARRAGVIGCMWGAGDREAGGSVSLLRGGAWAFAPMSAASPSMLFVGSLALSSVEGTDGVLSGCGDGCDGIASIRGSLVSVNSTGVDPSTFPSTLSRLPSEVAG